MPTREGQRPTPRFDRETYRRRNVIERRVCRLEENRRLCTCHEKLAVNSLAVARLAVIRRYVRLFDSPKRGLSKTSPAVNS